MKVSREEFLTFSLFMNFEFSGKVSREFITTKTYTVSDAYQHSSRLSDKAKAELNNIFKQYGQETI